MRLGARRGWVGVVFVDISLVEAPAIKRVGVGLAGKGGMVGSGMKLSFGAIRSQWWCVAQQGRGQRGGVGGYYLILDIGIRIRGGEM
eukprot:scaffold11223_cov57-Attheya_sp.AAC.12